MVDQAEPAFAVAERDQVLAEQAHALRLAVDGQVGGRQERDPVQPHQIAHRRAGADADEGFVVFVGKHDLRLVHQIGWTNFR